MSLSLDLPPALVDRAQRSHGVVTHEQLLADLAPRSITNAVQRGLLVPLHRGVYQVAGGVSTWATAAAAAVMYVDRQARRKLPADAPRPVVALSGTSAAHHLGLGLRAPLRLFLVSNPLSRSRAARIAHRPLLTADDVAVVDGIRCTSVAWTLLETSAHLRSHVGDNVVADAVRAGLVTASELAALAERTGLADPATICDANGPAGWLAARSGAERLLVQELHRRSVQMASNVNVVLRGRIWEMDLADLARRVDVEVDGRHHRDAAQVRVDAQRDADAAACGWLVLRVVARRVHEDVGAVADLVEATLRGRDPQRVPTPDMAGERR